MGGARDYAELMNLAYTQKPEGRGRDGVSILSHFSLDCRLPADVLLPSEWTSGPVYA